MRLVVLSAVLGGQIIALPEGTFGSAQQQRSPDSAPGRAALMQKHFVDVELVHVAVIRGNLAAVHSSARRLAGQDVPGLPAGATVHEDNMRRAAQRAVESPSIVAAASAVATMLATCGDCHRATRRMPEIPVPSSHEPGGFEGHMLAHQRAADLMVQGLVVPSSSLWLQGAEAFENAPLRRSDLPPDAAFSAIVEAEERVHKLAANAPLMGNSPARAGLYGDLVATCARCHALLAPVVREDASRLIR
jgi:cytochrome c553